MGPTSVPVGEKGRLTSTSCGWGAFKACVRLVPKQMKRLESNVTTSLSLWEVTANKGGF